MPARIYLPQALTLGARFALPPGPSRHLQVLRLQPGELVTLFNGQGGEWAATVTAITRREVEVSVDGHDPVDREAPCAVTLAVGMPANERMDNLIEKATELGVAVIQPLVCERSVLRLSGERADKKQAHWQAVAAAASEQCGRTRVPRIAAVTGLGDFLQGLADPPGGSRWVLSLRTPQPFSRVASAGADALFLSGPEGGLTEAEENGALARGFVAVSLGPRTLRADTAPLAALAWVVASASGPG